ncbi:unnamed protein product [Brassica rapa]|uniref:Cytochrome c domain-containing protein n=2 Tax=Brassica campestris TaxID=3711 RepID=A0A8D9MCK3_BRACM|nr:unnamed protein product [Brassica rapa]
MKPNMAWSLQPSLGLMMAFFVSSQPTLSHSFFSVRRNVVGMLRRITEDFLKHMSSVIRRTVPTTFRRTRLCLRKNPLAMVQIREGLHYNPYFPGGEIAMPKMLNDEAVEYEDGTPATEAQVDVISFLSWAAEPEMEERKLMGFKWIFLLSLALLQAAYYRRLKWSVLKSRKLVLDVVN